MRYSRGQLNFLKNFKDFKNTFYTNVLEYIRNLIYCKFYMFHHHQFIWLNNKSFKSDLNLPYQIMVL